MNTISHHSSTTKSQLKPACPIPQALIMYARPRLLAEHRCSYAFPPKYLSSVNIEDIFPQSKSRRDNARLQKHFGQPYLRRIQTQVGWINIQRLLFQLCSRDPPVIGALVHTDPGRVSALLAVLMVRILGGPAFWGSIYNQSMFNAIVHQFVTLPRRKSLHVQKVLLRFKLKQIRWLGPSSVANPDDLARRTRDLSQFLLFVFNKLIIPLIRTCFYVTESQHAPQTPMFFLHHHWLAFKQSQLSQLLDMNNFAPTFGLIKHAFRLLPKSKGSRILVKFRKTKPDFTKNILSVRAVLDILTCFAKEQGVHLSRWHYVHKQIRTFKRSVQSSSTFYYVSCDVSKAFDHIDPFLATAMVNSLLPQAGPIRMRKVYVDRHPGQPYVHSPFYTLLKTAPQPPGTEVLVSKPLLLSSVLAYIANIGIPMNRKLYRLRGIPQGSRISPILCDIILSKVQDRVSEYFQDPLSHRIVRWVDNWLFLTRSESETIQFVHVLNAELAHLGLSLKDKPESNVMHPSLAYSKGNIWCGLDVT